MGDSAQQMATLAAHIADEVVKRSGGRGNLRKDVLGARIADVTQRSEDMAGFLKRKWKWYRDQHLN